MTAWRLRGRVVLLDRILEDGVVEARGGVLSAVRAAAANDATPRTGLTLLPGLVDIHCHGGGGDSVTAGPAAAQRVVGFHAGRGTTRVVASVLSAAPAEMLQHCAELAELVDAGQLAGIHAEGPFLSPQRRGIHPVAVLSKPDRGFTEELVHASRGALRHVTLAPELPGVLAVVAQLADAGVVPAVGHTDASYAETVRAYEQGAALATHLFNGMRPWQHRAASAPPACLAAAAQGKGPVELIADGVHVDDATVAAVFTLAGPHGVVLVSDATAAAGMPDGEYRLGGMQVRARSGVVTGPDGTLAGGGHTLLDIVRRAHLHAGVPLVDAVRAASATPAATLGLPDATLRAGATADVVCVDDALRPVAVARAGSWLTAAPSGCVPA